MTPDRLLWTAFLRSKDEGSANKLLFRLQEALGCAMEISELARYWKDEAVYRCAFTTPLPADEGQGARESVLDLAGKLAPVWSVGGLGRDGDFWATADEHVVVSGVEMLSVGFGRSHVGGP